MQRPSITVIPPKVLPPKVLPPKVLPPKVLPPKVLPPKVLPPKVLPPKVPPPEGMEAIGIGNRFGYVYYAQNTSVSRRLLAMKRETFKNLSLCSAQQCQQTSR
ncbi:hypothetical protein Bpfe_006748 [Biomphalaria pfeifferi]|uniref:Uncharacterized protein n=1 Tax=Biomphalaria pfeifferi TaxID=112525 RepID=A0AAD8C0J3_BIOPF|nr:hypothetical protein Bpfe_006748 [Biomphalaria pfeifferi]